MSSVAAIMIVKDAIELDYCPVATIQTALQIGSLTKFLVNEGMSCDGTYELLQTIHDPRLEVIRRPWVMDKSFWAIERNVLIEEAKKYAEYVLILDADEFLFEENLAEVDRFVTKPGAYLGMHFQYRHFFRIADGNTVDTMKVDYSSSWYQSHAKLIHYSLNPYLAIVGDNADNFLGTFQGQRIFLHTSNRIKKKTNVFVGHFGYARDAEAAGRKFKRNDEIYQNSTLYKNGFIPEAVDFEYQSYRDSNHLAEIDFNLPEAALSWINAKHRKACFLTHHTNQV